MANNEARDSTQGKIHACYKELFGISFVGKEYPKWVMKTEELRRVIKSSDEPFLSAIKKLFNDLKDITRRLREEDHFYDDDDDEDNTIWKGIVLDKVMCTLYLKDDPEDTNRPHIADEKGQLFPSHFMEDITFKVTGADVFQMPEKLQMKSDTMWTYGVDIQLEVIKNT